MRDVFIASLTLALLACGDSDRDTAKTADGALNYRVPDTGRAAAAGAPVAAGQVATSRKAARADVAIPEEFSLYPGAELVSSKRFDAARDGGIMLNFRSDASPGELTDYYRREATAAGVVIDVDAQTGSEMMIAGHGPQQLSFSFQASSDGDGHRDGDGGDTTGTLVISR